MTESELPKPITDLKQHIDDMMQTARKVKGDEFASLVLFLLNSTTCAKVASRAVNAARNEAPEEVLEHLATGMTAAIGALCGQYIAATKLSSDLVSEAIKFAQNIDAKVDEAEEAMSKQ